MHFTKEGAVTKVSSKPSSAGTKTLAYNASADEMMQFMKPSRSNHIKLLPKILGIAFTVFCVGQTLAAQMETIGPSSRRTPLTISEIMYHPSARQDGLNGEFVEIYNSQLWPEDISGYRLGGGINYEFPPGTVIQEQSYLVIAKSPSDAAIIYDISNPLGPFEGSLNNQGETLRLLNRSNAVLLEIPFENRPPWPLGANGLGHSLILARPSQGEANPQAWKSSNEKGGSPGTSAPIPAAQFGRLQISEVWRHPESPDKSFIELVNRDRHPLDLSGVVITSLPTLSIHTIPNGVELAPGAPYLIRESDSGISLSDAKASVFLSAPSDGQIIDALQLIPHESKFSIGKSLLSPDRPALLIEPTPGGGNAPEYRPMIIINEIMYHPISGDSDLEYIELFNRSEQAIDLGAWQIEGDIRFRFPENQKIPSKGYVVIAKNLERLRGVHPHLNSENSIGDFQGRLSNSGQAITLSRQIKWITPGTDPAASNNESFQLVDHVRFHDHNRWSQWADGGGSSLELKDTESDNDFPGAWADSLETEKAEWSQLEFTGVLDRSAGIRPRSFQVQLLGAGECLIDDVAIFQPGSENQLKNSNFESDTNDWVFQGNHVQSTIEDGVGIESSRALHLTTTGRGDPHTNRVRSTLAPGDLRAPQEATIRAKVRWLRGHPEVLFRLQGNYIEAFHPMSVPENLGTPGRRNSVWEDNSAPVIQNAQHHPILPTSDDPILVTATIHDRDGIESVILNYRIDGGMEGWQTVKMIDDGSSSDLVSADGIYSGSIPPQPNRRMVAFHIEAIDQASQPSESRFPIESPRQNCLIRIGEPLQDNGLGVYRLWVSSDNVDEWRSSSRPNTSNEALDATFVYNDERVIYNVGATYSGSFFNSPRYTGPTGTPSDYAVRFTRDDAFLGASKIIVSWPGLTGSPDSTLQSEQFSYWMADQLDLPFNYRRYVTVFINGTKRNTVMEDTQRPNQDMVRQWFPNDTNGDLHKIQLRYESNDSANTTTAGLKSASLELRTNPDGTLQTSAYRWNWAPRSDSVSANRFAPLSKLIEAVNTSDPDLYLSRVNSLIDMEQWMRTFAVEHIVGNWDSYGYGNGQNMYAYKPSNGKWQLMIWDLDIGNGTGESPRTPLFKLTNPLFPQVNGDTTIVRKMFRTPDFERAFWRAVVDAVNGPMQEARVDQFLTTRFEKLRAAIGGNRPTSPRAISRYTEQRREYLIDQLNRLNTEFQITSPPISESTITTDLSPMIVTGTAPIGVKSIRANGIIQKTKWTDTTEWELEIPLNNEQTHLSLEGVDSTGNSIDLVTGSIAIVFNGEEDQLLPNIIFSEWMAVNESTIKDPSDGNFDDWFELHNKGAHPIDLTGFTLTDDLAFPSKWTFPEGSQIEPNSYLLVWADGTPTEESIAESFHVNFRLAREGEQLALFAPDGTLIDHIKFPEQTADISMGRASAQSSDQDPIILTIPSPGFANPAEGETPLNIRISHQPDKGTFSIEWEPRVSKSYQLQFKPNLAPSTPWVNLGAPVRDQPITIAIEPELGAVMPQGFYRMLLRSEAAN